MQKKSGRRFAIRATGTQQMCSKTCILALSNKIHIASKHFGTGEQVIFLLKQNHMPQAWLQMKLRHLRQGLSILRSGGGCSHVVKPCLLGSRTFVRKPNAPCEETLTETMCFLCWWKYIRWTFPLGVIIKGTLANSRSATPWSYGNELDVFHPSHSVWRSFITLHIHIIRILMHTCKENTMRKAMP